MDVPAARRVYQRDLPGDGFVAIDVEVVTSLLRGPRYAGRVVVERRANWRGERGSPPIIANATGPTRDSVVDQLLPVAQNNVSIAAALLRQSRRAGVVLGVGTGDSLLTASSRV